MKKMNRKGFTIVELVIVIAVIAILAAVMIPTFSGVTNRAKESARLQETRNAMMNYLAEQKNGVIANNTEFYYFDTAPTATKANVKAYKFVYNNGGLGDEAEVTGNITVSGDPATTTYTIGDADAITLVATDNAKVLIKAAN